MNSDAHNLIMATAGDVCSAAEIRGLVGNISDWDHVINLALEHRVIPMLQAKLLDFDSLVPDRIQARLARECELILAHNLANAVELAAVLDAFRREKIPAMPFKGIVLAAVAYGSFLSRAGGDLDFAVYAKDLKHAIPLLEKRGYQLHTEVRADGTPAVSDCYELHFERPADGMVLELRWRFDLVWNRFGRDLNMDWVWSNRQSVAIAGVDVPTISPDILLLLLCMHGSKHIWSRLIWVCDVAKLITSCPDFHWETIIAEANRLGLAHSMGLGVLLAVRMFRVRIPDHVLRRLEGDRAANRLSAFFAANMIDHPGAIPPGFLPYGMQLLDYRDRLGAVLNGKFVQPNERDLTLLHLPRPLEWVYYLLRPFRLLLDRSPR